MYVSVPCCPVTGLKDGRLGNDQMGSVRVFLIIGIFFNGFPGEHCISEGTGTWKQTGGERDYMLFHAQVVFSDSPNGLVICADF